MEVPCCGGLRWRRRGALQDSGKFIPWQVVTIPSMAKILAMPSILPRHFFSRVWRAYPFRDGLRKNPIVFYVIFGGCALLTFLPFLKCFPLSGQSSSCSPAAIPVWPSTWRSCSLERFPRSPGRLQTAFVYTKRDEHCGRLCHIWPTVCVSHSWSPHSVGLGSMSEAAMPMLIACGIVGPALLILLHGALGLFPFVRRICLSRRGRRPVARISLYGPVGASRVSLAAAYTCRQCGFRQVCSDRSDIPGIGAMYLVLKISQRWRLRATSE